MFSRKPLGTTNTPNLVGSSDDDGDGREYEYAAGALRSAAPTIPPALYRLPNSWTRRFLHVIAKAAVAREPLFSALVYMAATRSTREIIEIIMEAPLHRGAVTAIQVFFAPLAGANLVTDLSSVDWGVVDEFLYQAREADPYKWALTTGLLSLAMGLSYPNGSIGDLLPLGGPMADIQDPVTRSIVRNVTLAIIVFLGIVYYSLLTNRNIQKHANEFIDFFKKFDDSIREIKHHWAAYIEIWIETIGNAAYRGITFGSFFILLFSQYYEVNTDLPIIQAGTYVSAITTAMLTFFSRLLPVKSLFINDRFKTLTAADIGQASGLSWSLIPEIGFTVARAASVAIIMYEGLPTIWPLQFVLSLSFGAVIAGHSLYVRYMRLVYEAAYAKKSQQPIENRLFSISTLSHQTSERTPLLEGIKHEVTPITHAPTPGEVIEKCHTLFSTMVQDYKTQKLSTFVLVINIMTRIIRLVSFGLFVDTLAKGLNLELGLLTLFAITMLWGAEIFKSDIEFYQKNQANVLAGHSAKIALEQQKSARQREAQGLPSLSDTGWFSRLSAQAKQTVTAVFNSSYDYADELVAVENARLLVDSINAL